MSETPKYECWSIDAIPADNEELREGYNDGRKGDPEPGANRSPAYHHGWWAGYSDRHPGQGPRWLRVLAKQFFAKSKVPA